METVEERRKLAREIYDNFIMKELLSHTHVINPFDILLVTATCRLISIASGSSRSSPTTSASFSFLFLFISIFYFDFLFRFFKISIDLFFI